ncbi:MAG: hypothetical protein ACJAXA_000546 [Candidatus Aldehydirespiratoraceae bacterium]|jgi:hypothetical protein
MTNEDQMPEADGSIPEVDDDVWQRTEDVSKEEEEAQLRLSAIEAGRRKGGVVGAAMAGAMMVLQEIYQGPQKDEMVAVSQSPDEPGDIDKDGILISVGDVDVKTELPNTEA